MKRSFFTIVLLVGFFIFLAYSITLNMHQFTQETFSNPMEATSSSTDTDTTTTTTNDATAIQPPTDVPQSFPVQVHPANETQDALNGNKNITLMLPLDEVMGEPSKQKYYPININVNVYQDQPAKNFASPIPSYNLQSPCPMNYQTANPSATTTTNSNSLGYGMSSSLGYAPVFQPSADSLKSIARR